MSELDWQTVAEEIEGEALRGIPVVVCINGKMFEASDLSWNSYDDHESAPILYVNTA